MTSAYIKEIFSSLQGEGLYVGEKQLFIRFCGCNLKCEFCDTDFTKENSLIYTKEELLGQIKSYDDKTISLTGGEPLLHADFLKEFLPLVENKKIYLETNGTLYKELKKLKGLIDVIAADIKIESATNQKNNFETNELFFKEAVKICNNVFIKVVYGKNIQKTEIEEICKIAKKYKLLLILQPKMPLEEDFLPQKAFDDFFKIYKNVRLIPQCHKFLNLR